MVSIGNNGYNPYLAQYRKADGAKKANAKQSNRAPQIPNFPDKNITNVKGYTKSGTYSNTACGFSSKSEATDYVNSHAKEEALNKVAAELRMGVKSGDGWESIPKDCEERYNNSSIVISNEQINIDITSVKITENEDGTYNISYTVNYTVTCDYELTSDWHAGDEYTDENGYIWEYQEDGSWKDTGMREAIRNNDIYEDYDSDYKTDSKVDAYEMSTAEFLQMRNVGSNFKYN